LLHETAQSTDKILEAMYDEDVIDDALIRALYAKKAE
jgi:hypothetical protein